MLKATIDQRRRQPRRGARQLRRATSRPPRLPATVDTSKFAVGENLALTPGSVVLRTEVFELIQYAPQTEQVREVPLLFVPPTINKYYVARPRARPQHGRAPARPGPAGVRDLLAQPGRRARPLRPRHLRRARCSRRATRSPRSPAATAVHLRRACSGGIIAAGAARPPRRDGRLGEVASLTLLVCALDNERAGHGRRVDRPRARRGGGRRVGPPRLPRRPGAGGRVHLAAARTTWSGATSSTTTCSARQPPAFDVLYWNQDTVRLAAGLHRDFIHAVARELAHAARRADGARARRSTSARSTLDSYVVAGLTDHIIPWENAYRSTQLLGGAPRFVLSTSGHIQALVNPPARRAARATGSPTSTRRRRGVARAGRRRSAGSWWPDYDDWLAARSGELKPAPKRLGGGGYKALAKAPGSYVHAS